MAHVTKLGLRSEDEADLLADTLFARCWPGGCDDRHDPISIEWLRRWSPKTVTAARVACSCRQGRCGLCN